MNIPDDLLCLFTGRIEDGEDTYTVEIPSGEVEDGEVNAGDVYRIAIFPTPDSSTAGGDVSASTDQADYPEPPVDEGDVRTVEIEGIGDQGDGIARVDRGYVVIVPETDVGDEVTVEIEETHQNFAMAEVVDPNSA